jgi:hypothetical protein
MLYPEQRYQGPGFARQSIVLQTIDREHTQSNHLLGAWEK